MLLFRSPEALIALALLPLVAMSGYAFAKLDSPAPDLGRSTKVMKPPVLGIPGTGGANDIISLCREVIILTVHEKRRFSETVDFITSPGWIEGRDSRRKRGLLFGGVSRVVTTLGIFGFDAESRRMRLEALHAGVTVEDVRANTGFEVPVSDTLTTTKPPTEEELGILRMLDPARQFL